MGLLDSHIDRRLPALAAGQLGARGFRGVLHHAKTCHRCAALYQRSIATLRQLENGSPFEPARAELLALEQYNIDRVLPGGGALAWPLTRRWWFTAVLAASAAGIIGLTASRFLLPTDAELTARGGGTGAAATVRVFCGGGELPLRELREPMSCPPGHSLALAVGARSPLTRFAIRATGSATPEVEHSGEVDGAPGAETAVALTLPLQREGTAEVVVAFAATDTEALAAVRGASAGSGVQVLRRVVTVGR